MTLLIASLPVETLEQLRELAEKAWSDGADAIEVRIDGWEESPAALARFLQDQQEKTWIVTCRAAEERGAFRGDIMERVSLLLAASRNSGAYVDFEWRDWQRSDNIRQKVLLAAATPTDPKVHRLILSLHDFTGRAPDDVRGLSDSILNRRDTIAKIAYSGETIDESFSALDLVRSHGDRVIGICMGEAGQWTRVLAKKLGAFASYCSLHENESAAPGQCSINDMISRYRWREIGPSTQLFGLIGDPVRHSLSPLLFNHWFAATSTDAVYLPLLVSRGEDCLGRFLDQCARRPWLDIGGFSVTAPHKQAALRWLGDRIDRAAEHVGAVNTIVFPGGKAFGHNTDCHAAVDSIVNLLQCRRDELAGLTVDVLGTGGAARAVISGLLDFGCQITVFGRRHDDLRKIQRHFSCRSAAWEARLQRDGEMLVNCTTLGMPPWDDATPMPQDSLRGCRFVFDLIYDPPCTALLRDAAEVGAEVCNGLDMFLRQAATQFELWTGKTPDVGATRAWLEYARVRE